MDSEIAAIERTLQLYFDGLYHGDVQQLRKAFHDSCHLYLEEDGKLIDRPVADWFKRVESRQSPASENLARADRIVSMDVSGPFTAFAKVRCAIPPRFFTDYLTLLKLEEGWRIVSKTYRTATR